MKQKIKQTLEAFCSRHPRLSSLYYALFSRAMSHEHYTVLNGKLSYRTQGYKTVLRRNTHRLEKGLIMEPRRPNFALDYIHETVEAYSRVCIEHNEHDDSFRWSTDVLTRYFEVQAPNVVVTDAYAKFQAIAQTDPSNRVPFNRTSPSDITFEEFNQLNLRRRSVRWYKAKSVPRKLVDQAISAARQAPSACNRQPFFMRIYDSREMIEKVANLPGGTKGFSQNFPMVIAMTGQLRNYYSEADRHIIFIDASLFAMNFILALETLGLSSCIINWPENVETEQKAIPIMQLEKDERVIFLISVGYADDSKLVPFSEKKSLEDLRKYES